MTPSVLVMPTRWPLLPRMLAIRRTVVVLPLVPATATSGMRASSPSANMLPMIASPTARPFTERGLQVHAQARRGVQFDDAAVLFFERAQDVLQTISTPAMSRPTICAAAMARARSRDARRR